MFSLSGPKSRSNQHLLLWKDVTGVDWIFMYAIVLTWTANSMISFFADITSFVSFTLWMVSYQFAQIVEKSTLTSRNEFNASCKNWPELYSTYKVIRQLSEMINKTCGSIFAVYTGIAILQCTQTLKRILGNRDRDTVTLFSSVLWAAEVITMLFFSANICSQVYQLQEYIDMQPLL